MAAWTYESIPPQTGRIAVVTGSNSGIGYETARALARKGARVVMACRDAVKAEAAAGRIRAEQPAGSVEVAALDLSDLDSVRRFAEGFLASHERLDLLVNNAGVMVPPEGRTRQGFELQFGTNHLGHFALTAHLLPRLRQTPGSRVVVVSSTLHQAGRIDLDDLQFEHRSYNGWRAYGQSKLANLLFARELGRRLRAAGVDTLVTSAHPGWTATDLQRTSGAVRLLNPLFAMSPADGALPTLRAATDPDAHSDDYFGPSGLLELRGPPVRVGRSRRAQDDATSTRLWDASESLTDVHYGLPA